jgi:hypothetical protein
MHRQELQPSSSSGKTQEGGGLQDQLIISR